MVAHFIILCAGFGFTQGGMAETPPAVLSGRYPAGSIQSFDVADQALGAVAQERGVIEARFADDERACLPKFFATSCLEDAKERRRAALSQIRPLEIEANAFKRRARVRERDQALSERQAQEEPDAPLRSQEQLKYETRAAKKMQASVPEASSGTNGGEVLPDAADTRSSQHDAKLKRHQTAEIDNAKKRAENLAAYQKKLKEAEAHQQELALKKAQKERERTAKDARASPVR